MHLPIIKRSLRNSKLRFFLSLLASCINFIQHFVLGIANLLGWFTKQVIGEVHWQTPSGIRYSAQKIAYCINWGKRNPKQSAANSLFLTALILAGSGINNDPKL